MDHHPLLRLERLPHRQPSHLHQHPSSTRTQKRKKPTREVTESLGKHMSTSIYARIPRNGRTARELAEKAGMSVRTAQRWRSEEHTSELQSRGHIVCRLLLEKKNARNQTQASV